MRFGRVLPILLLLVLVLGGLPIPLVNSVTLDGTVMFQYTNVAKVQNNVTHTMNFNTVAIGSNFWQLNNTKIFIRPSSPFRFNISYLSSAPELNSSMSDKILSFTANQSGAGPVDFNISGFIIGRRYRVMVDGIELGRYIINVYHNLSFRIPSWSGHSVLVFFAGNSIGTGIRSDGSYLYRTMEDGVNNVWNQYKTASNMSLDSNSSLEGKYSLHIQRDTSKEADPFTSTTTMNLTPMMPHNFSFRFKINSWTSDVSSTSAHSIFYIRNDYSGVLTVTELNLFINKNGTFSVYDKNSNSIRFFPGMTYQNNTVYRFTAYDIVYAPKTGTTVLTRRATHSHVRLSNATASSDILNVYWQVFAAPPVGTVLPINVFEFRNSFVASGTFDLYVDDWTVGTQMDIETGVSTVQHEYNATTIGALPNDGSPLQNQSQHTHLLQVLYDTGSTNTSGASIYFFNETSASEQWRSNPFYMNDSSNTTFASSGTYEHSTKITGSDPFTSSTYIGQVFTVGCNGTNASFILKNIYIYLSKTGSPTSGIYMTVKNTTTAHYPGTITYTTAYLNGADITGAGIYKFTMNNDSILSKGNEYCFYLNATTTVFNCYRLGSSNIDYYPKGGMIEYAAIPGWSYIPQDAYFTMFGLTEPELLVNHTGNVTSPYPRYNISRVEIAILGNLSSDSYAGRIMIQPVFNSTNGSYYDTSMHAGSGSLWSDWIDITSDPVRSSKYWVWGQIKGLKARVSANLTSGQAYVNRIAMRVSFNLTQNYTNSASLPSASYDTGDTLTKKLTGLTPGQLYYYRYSGRTNYTNSSSGDYGTEAHFLSRPCAPTSPHVSIINETCVNLTWTNGTGHNRTVLIRNITGSPTWPTDPGVGIIIYNGTGTYYNLTLTPGVPIFISGFSYTYWNISIGGGTEYLSRYSDNHTVFNFSILGFNVFNESNTTQAIPFTLEITNADAGIAIQAYNVTNTYYVNISSLPNGETLHFVFSSPGYRERSVDQIIYNNTIYNFTYYLPLIELPSGTPGENYTRMYRVHVINEYSSPIANAFVEVKRYINATGEYSLITSFYTNGYGDGDMWLIPSTHYKVFISKTGYQDVIGTDWITDPVFYGADYPKIFQMTPSTIISSVFDNITWSIEPVKTSFPGSFTCFYNLTCSDFKLEWMTMTIARYNTSSDSWNYLYSHNDTTLIGGSMSYTIANITGVYKLSCSFKKTGFSNYTFPDMLYSIYNSTVTPSDLDDLITHIVGKTPVYVRGPSGEVIVSWTAVIASFISIFVLFGFSPKFAGLAIIALGSVLGVCNGVINLIPNTVLSLTTCGVIIILGIILTIELNKET